MMSPAILASRGKPGRRGACHGTARRPGRPADRRTRARGRAGRARPAGIAGRPLAARRAAGHRVLPGRAPAARGVRRPGYRARRRAGPGRRHPLPAPARFEAAMRRAGVCTGSTVVAYDEADGTVAARAWWLLRYFGHRDCRVLDGGFRAWVASGGPVATGDGAAPGGGNFTARPGQMPVLDAGAAASLARRGALLDARAGERYRGEREPVDPVAGHIPGALSAPTTANAGPGRPVPARGRAARQVRRPGCAGQRRAGGRLLRLRRHRRPRGAGTRTGGHPRFAVRRLLVQLGGRPGPPGGHRAGAGLAVLPHGSGRYGTIRCAAPSKCVRVGLGQPGRPAPTPERRVRGHSSGPGPAPRPRGRPRAASRPRGSAQRGLWRTKAGTRPGVSRSGRESR